MPEDPNARSLSFSDKDVRRIISRAVQVCDSERDRVSEDMLRAIARELQIGDQAISQAISEHARAVRIREGLRAARVKTFSAPISYSLGIAYVLPIAMFDTDPLWTAVAIYTTTGVVAAITSGPQRYRRVWITSLSLWVGFLTAGALTTASFPPDAIPGILKFAGAGGLAGSLILSLRDWMRSTTKRLRTGFPDSRELVRHIRRTWSNLLDLATRTKLMLGNHNNAAIRPAV